jgi:hypothetical protein
VLHLEPDTKRSESAVLSDDLPSNRDRDFGGYLGLERCRIALPPQLVGGQRSIDTGWTQGGCG